MNKREECLRKANECVNGQRQEDYGAPEDNFGLIADLWSCYLDYQIDEVDVCMMMSMLKIARIKTGQTADSFIDLAGYAACGYEIAGGEKARIIEVDVKTANCTTCDLSDIECYEQCRNRRKPNTIFQAPICSNCEWESLDCNEYPCEVCTGIYDCFTDKLKHKDKETDGVRKNA